VTETRATAVYESLSKPCTIREYPGGNSKEDIITEYILALTVIGKCELQRKGSFKLSNDLKQLYDKTN